MLAKRSWMINKQHLAQLIELGLVEMQEDVPQITIAGQNAGWKAWRRSALRPVRGLRGVVTALIRATAALTDRRRNPGQDCAVAVPPGTAALPSCISPSAGGATVSQFAKPNLSATR